MDIHAGIWVDRTKALIVMFVGEEASVSCIEFNISQYFRSYKAQQLLSLYDNQSLIPESRIDEQIRKRMHKYYKRIINDVEYADQVFIFGPDETRLELKKAMSKSKERLAKIVGVEKADQMSERQIIAKVKSFYNHKVLKGIY